MNNRELIYSLIRLSLAEVDDGFEVFEGGDCATVAVGFVWDKFVPILMGRKFEAD